MLEIRKAGIHDIGLIQELAHATWPVAYKEMIPPNQLGYMLDLIYKKQALANQVENLHHQFIIARENELPVGFASYSPKIPGDTSVYRLHKLYVLPGQQGKGTGKFLLNFIIEEIKPVAAKILELNVNRQNPALHFYKKIGFTILREEDIDIGEGYFMNDYVMELKIKN